MHAAPARATPRIPPWLWDAGGSALIVALAFGHYPGESTTERSVIGYIAVLLPAAFVLVRRRWPWFVLAACVACFGVAAFTFPASAMSSLAATIAVYTLAERTDRRTTLIVGLCTAAVLIGIVAISSGELIHPATFQVIVTIGFGASLGDAVRSRRAYIAEIMARADRAEATREAEASRRVAEERLRIARDLHDVVAHQISVISLNAGVATSSLESRPDTARDALATIRSASRQVLREIGDLLAVLRSPGDDAPVAPAAGLAQLESLVGDFERAGLHVTTRIDGDLTVPPAIDLVAYRVIHEALTNALKHGSDARTAHVLVARQDAGDRATVEIVVTNPLADAPRASLGSGNGLLGLRERVAAVRGDVVAAPDGNTFRLAVHLPAHPAGAGTR